ncbi:non-hydrolyzing UDP-N-acetylglucosamine 2-epimerase [Flavobacterium johnsoniae]|uniref:UDP-N-acetylglucosamine 2-epimerase (non-hydrolyzing) n=1 Tax=Flavobacterium johnsoniae TaxID=986 RepID=A0A1M5L4X2_FLAJO|nr:UDP-N-acetylglucosamine 2-epimerase (non-hydrolyzing) [Flavobacterium johnsoniae]SHG59819.1 UDP-N-Acetylglucosamine 2-epimerase [Flavobacterium johnsoniae]
MKRKILIVFGTRPEAIKMAPLVKEFQKYKNNFETKVCVTAQHREMLDQVLDFFEILPDFDLNLMKPGQNLFTLTADVIVAMKSVFDEFSPDYVFVHGDTTTSTAAALASFYAGIKVCHIEAGLRTYNKLSPFPEEMNRQITGRLADFHFSPTKVSEQNLLKEGISKEVITVTGNTVIDALIYSSKKVNSIYNEDIQILKDKIDINKKILLVTGHRRENHGDGFINICRALKTIAVNNKDVQIVYPVHLNPKVMEPVYDILSGYDNIKLIDPLPYPAFVWLMNKCYLIITDSGGVQEEAPSLGKPVLVMRDNTERPEAVEAKTVLLVGTNEKKIVDYCQMLLYDRLKYDEMKNINNPYGDGNACKRIVDFFLKERDN